MIRCQDLRVSHIPACQKTFLPLCLSGYIVNQTQKRQNPIEKIRKKLTKTSCDHEQFCPFSSNLFHKDPMKSIGVTMWDA